MKADPFGAAKPRDGTLHPYTSIFIYLFRSIVSFSCITYFWRIIIFCVERGNAFHDTPVLQNPLRRAVLQKRPYQVSSIGGGDIIRGGLEDSTQNNVIIEKYSMFKNIQNSNLFNTALYRQAALRGRKCTCSSASTMCSSATTKYGESNESFNADIGAQIRNSWT